MADLWRWTRPWTRKMHPTSWRKERPSSWTKWAEGAFWVGVGVDLEVVKCQKLWDVCKSMEKIWENTQMCNKHGKKTTSQKHVDVLLHSFNETWQIHDFQGYTASRWICKCLCHSMPNDQLDQHLIHHDTTPAESIETNRSEMNQYMSRRKALVHLWNPNVWIQCASQTITMITKVDHTVLTNSTP